MSGAVRPVATARATSAGRRLRAAAHALGSRAEYEASEERRRAVRAGTVPLAEVSPRTRARLSGVVRNVMLRASESVPVLEAELFDGSGSLRVLWIGRRRVGGVEPGRRMVVDGLVSTGTDGRRTLYNPRYDLIADEERAR